ncbi:MAG: bifunctional phosphoglucose/phosphomannose isomerase [Anaerolineae bacterium]|jgi:glucose/mannose-6-phosphate isomerase
MTMDDLRAIARLDSENMLRRIEELPGQCLAAWKQAQGLTLPLDYGSVDHLVIVGMGGSAIGGALLEGLVVGECEVPITVIRGYDLPAFARRPGVLVVACSYSGNTEETLSCLKQALDGSALAMAITTGGKLAALARNAGVPVVQFGYEAQPRAALGYSFLLLLGVVFRLGFVPDYTKDLAEAARVMNDWEAEIAPRVPTVKNPAKKLANRIAGSLPVTYGARFLAAVANRWKTQFNENAKHWAFFDVLPELNHNSVVGFSIPELVRDHSIVLMLRSHLDSRPVQERWAVTRELLDHEGVAVREVYGRGKSALAQVLSLVHFGDYVSFYLAMLNEVDPTPVETIAFLKQRLAELGKASE